MIFRDKNTGSLLNVRRDQHITDRMYFQEIIRVVGNGKPKQTQPRFVQPFNELTPVK